MSQALTKERTLNGLVCRERAIIDRHERVVHRVKNVSLPKTARVFLTYEMVKILRNMLADKCKQASFSDKNLNGISEDKESAH